MEKLTSLAACQRILPSPLSDRPRRQYRVKLPLSLGSAIFVVLAFQFLILPRYVYQNSASSVKLSQFYLSRLDTGLQKCAEYNTAPINYPVPTETRANPRWNPKTGQNETIVLRNATLFDGERILKGSFDIKFTDGVIKSVSAAGTFGFNPDVKTWDLGGKFVTPGLVDMHSHHLAMAWPSLSATDDTNEVSDDFGALTPFVRAIDSIKAYDEATTIVASGGVTTSLILPGSANIMGGEAFLVKNLLRSGPTEEEVVEDILLEHGVPTEDRRRYMKMACGENPRRVYKHTRMGNAWIFRKHMERARVLREKQDAWCLSAAAIKERGDDEKLAAFMKSSSADVDTDALELDSTIAMLRGKIGVNVHCYETEDFEDMLAHSKEFGFRIQAFHHALSAWQVPELIKDSEENITIATFSEFGFYKKEGYESNLWAGKILAEHGVPVAYKSDHVTAETNAKYLLVPARSLEIDHRVGFVRPGYDADVVVWDSHPLSVGATPMQVYIDGRATLDPLKVAESQSKIVRQNEVSSDVTKQRKVLPFDIREKLCADLETVGRELVITGIKESFLHDAESSTSEGNFTMVIQGGSITCFAADCASSSSDISIIALDNGYVLPGLTAVSVSLGLLEIPSEERTKDGTVGSQVADAENIVYAKYGVHLDGKNFRRARIGGVTKAISAPQAGGLSGGVSVGIKTKEQKTLSLEDGIFQDEVALHVQIGQVSKATDSISTVSASISKLRQLLSDNKKKGNVYGKAANGSIPLVAHAENEYDIAQLIDVGKDYPELKLVILGGSGAHLVAEDLAKAKIPVILTANRGAPDTWEKRNTLFGPPLTKSAAAVLSNAGVTFGLAIDGEVDAHIHNLPIEAGWAAKYAGLGKREAVDLVSRNIEKILGLEVAEEKRDFVVWEGNPMEFGASVAFSFDAEKGAVGTCWPEST